MLADVHTCTMYCDLYCCSSIGLEQEIFELTVMALEKLSLSSSCCYTKAVSILGRFATVRSCLVMLDLECDELIVEIFSYFSMPLGKRIEVVILVSLPCSF